MVSAFPPSIDWLAIGPVLIVSTTGILALLLEVIWPKRSNWPIVAVSLGGLVIAAFLAATQLGFGAEETFGGMVRRDDFGLTMQLLVIGATFVTILFSETYLREKRIPFGEFYPLVLWSSVGAMVMASTSNLLMIFLGLEILSISLYVMAGMSRSEEKSEESALKYFLLGAFASAFLLYGIALVYGATGSIHLDAIAQAWNTPDSSIRPLLLFGLGMMLIGFSFKASFVPFHQWTPDVYQGAPTNVTTFMASVSKIGAFAALIRVLDGMQVLSAYWLPALTWIAILTMVFGNLIALVQKDVKRILGYSSIAHAGYVLVGIVAHYRDPAHVGLSTVAYYLLAYCLMTIGAFAVVSLVARGGKEGTRLRDLYGLWDRSPLAAGVLVVCVYSLIGIPPSAGFFGKWLIFRDAVASGSLPLAIVLAIMSVVSTYYYLGIMRAAFVADEEGAIRPAAIRPGLAAACVICGGGVIAAAVFFTPITNFLVLR